MREPTWLDKQEFSDRVDTYLWLAHEGRAKSVTVSEPVRGMVVAVVVFCDGTEMELRTMTD